MKVRLRPLYFGSNTLNGAAAGDSKPIAVKLTAGPTRKIAEEIVGVKTIVAEILPRGDMEAVPARSEHHIDLSAGFGSELRRIIATLYTGLQDRR